MTVKRSGWWQRRSVQAAGWVVGCISMLAVVLGLTGSAHAHDPSKHRASAIRGVVVSADSNTVTIDQGGKETTFTISPETKVMRNEASVPVGDVKPGSQVAVFATKLPDGTTVASEINLVNSASGEDAHVHGHSHGGADGSSK